MRSAAASTIATCRRSAPLCAALPPTRGSRRSCSASCTVPSFKCGSGQFRTRFAPLLRKPHVRGRDMFISKLSLSRRTFLRGLGVTVALPLLDAMVPASTALAATAANPRLRFGAVYIPNGAVMSQWIPKTAGANFELMPIMQPLEPFRKSLVVVTNLCRAGGDVTGDHAVSSAGWMSGVVAKRTEAEDVRVGPTVDQIIAKEIGQDTPFPSLEVATEDFTGYVGGCVPGYSCAFMNTISWATATTSLPIEINTRNAFKPT